MPIRTERIVEPWSEDRIRERLRRRASERGISLTRLFQETGVGHNFMSYTGSPRVDSLDKLAKALNWTLPELLGCRTAVDVEISTLAFRGADDMRERLPPWARTPDNYIQAHATIYDLLIARQNEGRLPTDTARRVEILRDYVELLARAWQDRPEPGRSEPTTVSKTLKRMRIRPRKPAPSNG